ncbi:hypothetical protein X975_02960, partial [Stegodyphus mimosarum]
MAKLCDLLHCSLYISLLLSCPDCICVRHGLLGISVWSYFNNHSVVHPDL